MQETGLDVTRSLQRGLDDVLDLLPNLFGALVVLLVGYGLARVAQALVVRGLDRIGADRLLYTSRAGDHLDRLLGDSLASRTASSVVFWVVMLGALGVAASVLGARAVSDLVGIIYGYVANLVAAAIIVAAGLMIAAAVGALVHRTIGGTPTGRVVGSAVRVLVIAVAVFMALDQLEIAPQIIAITYAAVAGSVALALALAFGLGGSDVAARLLSDSRQRGRAARARVRADIALARTRYAESAPVHDDAGRRGPRRSGRLLPAGAAGLGHATRAQKLALGLGVALALMGLLGFFADATFDTQGSDTTPGGFQGDGFLGFEVNGWHNLFHLVTGAALMATAGNRRRARTGALVFGALYVLISLIGLIDGDNVLGVLPVNAADNVLHPVLAGLAIWAGLTSSSSAYDPEGERRRREERERWREERERAAIERERLAAQQEVLRWERRDRGEPATTPLTASSALTRVEPAGSSAGPALERQASPLGVNDEPARDGVEGARARDRVRLDSALGDAPTQSAPALRGPAEERPAGSRRLREPAIDGHAAEPLPADPDVGPDAAQAPSGSRRLT